MLWSPLGYTSDRNHDGYFIPRINDIEQTQPFKIVRENKLEAIKTGLAAFYNAKDWATYIKQAQDNGFYLD
jgi:hypothetical protein